MELWGLYKPLTLNSNIQNITLCAIQGDMTSMAYLTICDICHDSDMYTTLCSRSTVVHIASMIPE